MISRIIITLIGIALSYLMVRHRQWVGDLFGEAEWMSAIGGVYNMVIILAAFLFFWSLAYLTGTTTLFLTPILWLIPHAAV